MLAQKCLSARKMDEDFLLACVYRRKIHAYR